MDVTQKPHLAAACFTLLTKKKKSNQRLTLTTRLTLKTKALLLLLLLPPPGPTTRKIRLQELAQHNAANDLWAELNGTVCDLNVFAGCHPGGSGTVTGVAGRGAPQVFESFHSQTALRKLVPFNRASEGTDTFVQDFMSPRMDCNVDMSQSKLFWLRQRWQRQCSNPGGFRLSLSPTFHRN
jgi:hypothetical protein